MEYQFYIFNHQNITNKHKTTLEITKDKHLTLNGDCIVGINSDFKINKLKSFLKYKYLSLKIGDDVINFETNTSFNGLNELVIRKSNFISDRTFGINSDKASCDLKIINSKIKVKLFNFIPKLIIFDFDNTLEDYYSVSKLCEKKISVFFKKKYSINPNEFINEFDSLDLYFSHKGVGKKDTSYFERTKWFKKLYSHFNLEYIPEEVNALIKQYWDCINTKAKLLPNAIKLLDYLKKQNIKLVCLSDSDGSKKLKIARLKNLGVFNYFDYILLGDDLKLNKPNKLFYKKINEKFNIKYFDMFMVGDKPQVDLKLAKSLGIKTIWIKHGKWAKEFNSIKFDYVDYEIDNLSKLIGILK